MRRDKQRMMHYCTSFNEVYLLRGLALYRSLAQHSKEPFTLWVLCFDDRSFDVLSQLNQPNLRPISIATLEAADPALLTAKQNRSMVEYFFTCSPIWPLYLLQNALGVDQITYLDADLFFFSDPQPVFDEMGDASILIVPHRFPEHLKHREAYGIYNVGLLSFRNDERALTCLRWWRERCLEWCYDILEEKRFADQKYLDDWPTRFEGVHVLQHPGANLAPWNVMRYGLSTSGNTVQVDGQPVIFFHYQGFKVISQWVIDPGLYQYGVKDRKTKRLLFQPYAKALVHAWRWARVRVPDLNFTRTGLRSRAYSPKTFLFRLAYGHLMFYSAR